MNLLLLLPEELSPEGVARLRGRRAEHAREVLGARAGDALVAGVLGGRLGSAEVLSSSADELVVRATLDRDPPPRCPVELVLALPRPKVLRRVLQSTAAMGLAKVVLLGSWNVEKSYWGSPSLAPDAVRAELMLGLEQGRDTILPDVVVRRLFKPFVEDELDAMFAEGDRLLADNAAPALLDATAPRSGRAVLAIGPEGGWTPYEARRLAERGFAPFSFGARALRVDAAVAFAVGQLELWLRARSARGA